jgi:hypothetical protein
MTTSELPDTPGWTVSGGLTSGQPVDGLPADVWARDWRYTDEVIRVRDPLYGKQVVLGVTEIDADDGVVTFAYTEITNGVYLFALPTA